MSSAYRKLRAGKLRWFELHAKARTGLAQALLARAQGQARVHIADGVLAALDPAGPDFVEWRAQMMRLQASGLELTEAATRHAAFMFRQTRRTAKKLADGD